MRSVLPSPWFAVCLAGCAGHAPPPAEPAPVVDPVAVQQERASVEGPDQTLEQCRLASMAFAEGQVDVAERALRQAVVAMQDFRAEGEFRALVGEESTKEWKGDPYEKMMAFLDLGLLLLEEGDEGNALAMTKSAILADTGTSRFQYRADFVPAFVLQAVVFDRLGEHGNAERSIGQAVDAIWLRALTRDLSARLAEVEVEAGANGEALDPDGVAAARVLLLSGLPAGLAAHPREVDAAIDGALSRATDLRRVALDGSRRDRPEELSTLSRGALDRSFDALEPLVRGWHAAAAATPTDTAQLRSDEARLTSLIVHPPRLMAWVETGRGPQKRADGEYGEILRIVPRDDPSIPPAVTLDGRTIEPVFLDSVSYQASTRGSRWVDGFLKGKAVFKDAAPFLGWALLVSGDVARSLQDSNDSGAVGTALYVIGAATWVAGAIANPRADTRGWDELPEGLWLVTADAGPGPHQLVIDGRTYRMDLPDDGQVVTSIPSLPPGGRTTLGRPCTTCAAPATEAIDAPLAIPQSP
ncbi:MAG: hypothetical protein ABMB14_00250 [Myxococcota bacterium]